MNTPVSRRRKSSFPLIVLFFLLIIAAGLLVLRLVQTEKEPSPADTSAQGSETAQSTEISHSTEIPQSTEAPDVTAPVILGAHDQSFPVGTSVLYKSGVTAADDRDGEVSVTADTSAVDRFHAGNYPVVYTASDAAGNTASVTVFFTFTEETLPPETADSSETADPSEPSLPESTEEPFSVLPGAMDTSRYQLKEEVHKIMDKILTPEMSEEEKLRAVWNWTRTKIGYDNLIHTEVVDRDGWEASAIYGIIRRKGSCYMYYAVLKAFLTELGYETIDITDCLHDPPQHYWLLVQVDGEWRHIDSTPRQTGAKFFLSTDKEILDYSKAHGNPFEFDLTKYPRTPGELPDEYLRPYYPELFDENGQRLPETQSAEEPSSAKAAAGTPTNPAVR